MSVHGKDCYFAVDDASDMLRDLSADVDNVDIQRKNDLHDDTTFGQTGHTRKGGLTDGTVTLSGMYSSTANTGTYTVLKGLLGRFLPTDFEAGVEGNANGKPKVSGKAVLDTFTTSTPVADLVKFQAVFQVSGALTDGTFSA